LVNFLNDWNFQNGALLDSLSGPGVHWLQPFVTDVVEVRITPETKTLDPMVCTTRDGVKNVFRDVQVKFALVSHSTISKSLYRQSYLSRHTFLYIEKCRTLHKTTLVSSLSFEARGLKFCI